MISNKLRIVKKPKPRPYKRRVKKPEPTEPPAERDASDIAPDVTKSRKEAVMQIRMMASTETSLKAMAEVLGITQRDLTRKFRRELNIGHEYCYGVISLQLLKAAFGGDGRAQLAWMKQFGGWQDVSRKEITGKNGEPISIQSLDGPSLLALAQALGQKGVAGGGRGRAKATIDADARDVIDLDAIPGAADECAGE